MSLQGGGMTAGERGMMNGRIQMLATYKNTLPQKKIPYIISLFNYFTLLDLNDAKIMRVNRETV